MKKSVQESVVPIETVEENLVCLHTPRRSYRAILEVSGLNYLLKGEDEQAALSLIFQQILGGLKHPLQILLRTEPFDQERYLQPFADTSDLSAALLSDPILLNADLPEAVRWQRLNSTYRQFFRTLAAGRTLLERHFYLIIPADPVLSPEERLIHVLRRRRSVTREQAQEQASQQLDLRCGEITRQLAGLGLTCRQVRASRPGPTPLCKPPSTPGTEPTTSCGMDRGGWTSAPATSEPTAHLSRGPRT